LCGGGGGGAARGGGGGPPGGGRHVMGRRHARAHAQVGKACGM